MSHGALGDFKYISLVENLSLIIPKYLNIVSIFLKVSFQSLCDKIIVILRNIFILTLSYENHSTGKSGFVTVNYMSYTRQIYQFLFFLPSWQHCDRKMMAAILVLMSVATKTETKVLVSPACRKSFLESDSI